MLRPLTLFVAPFVAAALLAPAPASAELPPLVPRDALFLPPEQDKPQISPDGRWLLWARRADDGIVNLWVRGLDRDTSFQLTHDHRRGVLEGWWTGDSKRVLFGQDRDGDENFHLWAIDLAGGEARDLTPFPNVRVELVRKHSAHPGFALASLNRRDPRVFDMHRVNLETGEVTLDTENPGDVIEWTTDPDFRVRACTALRASDGATELRVRDAVGAPWRTLHTWSMDDAVIDRARKILGFLDANTLLVQTWIGSETSRLVTMDARDGRVIATLASDPRADLWSLMIEGGFVPQVLLSPKGDRVQAAAFEHLKVEWKVIDPAVRADFEALKRLAGGATFAVADRSSDDRRWIVGIHPDVSPGRYVLWDRSRKKATDLFELAPALSRWTFAAMKPLTIRASDGLELPCYLTLPPGLPAKGLPLVVNPHGGPWYRDGWFFNPEVQWLANRGYAVLQVNFRGSTGFGKRHTAAGNLEFGPGKTQQDLVDAAQWLVKEGIADPKRIGIMGGSFGGYATLAGLAFRPELFACGVDVVGPANLRTLIESFPPYWEARKKRWLARMGNVIEDDALNRKLSPVFHAASIRAPLLIGHGANDPRVKLAEAEAMAKAMREHGRDVTLVVYPDEGHGFGRADNAQDFYGRAEEFLGKHLGGRVEPWRKIAGTTADVRTGSGAKAGGTLP